MLYQLRLLHGEHGLDPAEEAVVESWEVFDRVKCLFGFWCVDDFVAWAEEGEEEDSEE